MATTGRLGRSVLTVLFMAVTTLVFVSILTGVHLATQDRVRVNQAMFLRGAVLSAAGRADQGASLDELNQLYEDIVVERTDPAGEVTHYVVGGSAYVIIASGPGLWGEIVAAIGFEGDLRTLTGISVIDQNETPGLGGRITESWFTGQFAGKRGPFTFVPEGSEAAEDEFDAITGATTTTGAIRDILNRTVDDISAIVR